MSDAAFAWTFGSLIWFAGGAGFVASLISGWTLFAPFAAVFIVLGAAYCALGTFWALRRT